MWAKFYDLVKAIFTFGDELQNPRSDVKRLQQELRELSAVVQRLAYEIRLVSENEAHARENLALRLENQFLRSERQLPAAGASSEAEELAAGK